MGEPNLTTASSPPALPPNTHVVPYASAPPPPPGAIDYFRFAAPQEAGWTSVASFGTASVWHEARDLLVQQRIVCRMVADTTHSSTEDQRMELLVMASEAEWARDILRRGIPGLGAEDALPPGGFQVVTASRPGVPPPLPEWVIRSQTAPPMAASAAPPHSAPLAALPVAPVSPVAAPGTSAAYTIVLVLAFLVLILLIISMIVVCFIPGF